MADERSDKHDVDLSGEYPVPASAEMADEDVDGVAGGAAETDSLVPLPPLPPLPPFPG